MRILYTDANSKLEEGRPYTWGLGNVWYVLLAGGKKVLNLKNMEALNETQTRAHIDHVLRYDGFRYATYMEIQ